MLVRRVQWLQGDVSKCRNNHLQLLLTAHLAKMGDMAPSKLKSFLNALKPMLDKNSTTADLEAMAQTLQSKGVVQLQGEVVSYPK